MTQFAMYKTADLNAWRLGFAEFGCALDSSLLPDVKQIAKKFRFVSAKDCFYFSVCLIDKGNNHD